MKMLPTGLFHTFDIAVLFKILWCFETLCCALKCGLANSFIPVSLPGSPFDSPLELQQVHIALPLKCGRAMYSMPVCVD